MSEEQPTSEPNSTTPPTTSTEPKPDTEEKKSPEDVLYGEGDEPSGEGDAPDEEPGDKKEEDKDLLFEEDKEEEEGDTEEKDEKEEKDDEDGEKEKDDDDEEGDKEPDFDVDKLEIPADMPVPDDVKEELTTLAKENNWTQEQAQKAVDLHIKVLERQSDQWQKQKEEWRQETMKDPTIGGENWDASKKAANDVVRAFWADPKYGGSPELLKEFQTDLQVLGLGNKRSFIMGLVNLATATANDSIAGTGIGTGERKLDAATVLYGEDGQGRKR